MAHGPWPMALARVPPGPTPGPRPWPWPTRPGAQGPGAPGPGGARGPGGLGPQAGPGRPGPQSAPEPGPQRGPEARGSGPLSSPGPEARGPRPGCPGRIPRAPGPKPRPRSLGPRALAPGFELFRVGEPGARGARATALGFRHSLLWRGTRATRGGVRGPAPKAPILFLKSLPRGVPCNKRQGGGSHMGTDMIYPLPSRAPGAEWGPGPRARGSAGIHGPWHP